jgi:23S rRNA (adenine2030-N6)-methyltransferase
MNYRHAFHAGNFADVFKHAVFSRILVHLMKKDAPLRVVETHAGAGSYDLSGEPAQRTGEWVEGIGRLLETSLDPHTEALLAPWLAIVRSSMAGQPPLYPGSPRLAQALLRPQDRLTLFEKHPADGAALAACMRGDKRVTVRLADGWSGLPGVLPPPERRGVVLIDPPYEAAGEPRQIVEALQGGLRRFAHGIYAVWYPIKGRRDRESFGRRMAQLPATKILRAEIGLYEIERIDRLNGCGMVVINPPWHLDEELTHLAAAFAQTFAREGRGQGRVDWLSAE